MSTTRMINCPGCGKPAPNLAFQCPHCKRLFSGSAGHTVRPAESSRPSAANSIIHVGASSPCRDLVSVAANGEALLRDIEVAIVEFNEHARVHTPPTRPGNIGRYKLETDYYTNLAGGLTCAGQLWFNARPDSTLDIVVFSDGDANTGEYGLMDAKQAAVAAADKLKARGVRCAGICFEGPSVDPEPLRAIASKPALFWMGNAAKLATLFRESTTTLARQRSSQNQKNLLIFVLDASISMDEGDKKPALENAVQEGLRCLIEDCWAIPQQLRECRSI